ncbi:sodium/calcium exchanger NCL-like [Forsythia ovata]|uniref:Sodium/calcium exchanger NCL-like n=1 Tax=Forsythia ovata TaxID=205694 RepID=A0ABD1S617_9LAMI
MDKDADIPIAKSEMERLTLDIIKTRDVKLDKQFAVSEVMEVFDFNNDGTIDYQEFVSGCTKWITETKQLTKNGDSSSTNIVHEASILFIALFDSDNNNEISKIELEQLIRTVKFGKFQLSYEDVVKELFNDFDKDGDEVIDEPKFVNGLKKWLDKAIHVANSSDKVKSIGEYDKVIKQMKLSFML